MESEDYWAEVKRFIAEWHRPLEAGDGYTEVQIQEAEARLGMRLPEALRELYLLLGKRDDIVRIYNRLLNLEKLKIVQGHLVFWTENQGVSDWCIKLENISLPNPFVSCWMIYADALDVSIGEEHHSLTEEILSILVTDLFQDSNAEPPIYICPYILEDGPVEFATTLNSIKYQSLYETEIYQSGDILIYASPEGILLKSRSEISLLEFVEKHDYMDFGPRD